jgi:hypothetical protein
MSGLRQLRIIYFALLTGQIIYFLGAFFLVSDNLVVLNENYDSVPGLLISILVIILVVIAKLFYTQAINRKIRESSLKEKLYSYRINNIIKYALLEASDLLSITYFLLTGDFLFVGMSLIVIGLFLINIPGREKFISDYELKSSGNKWT